MARLGRGFPVRNLLLTHINFITYISSSDSGTGSDNTGVVALTSAEAATGAETYRLDLTGTDAGTGVELTTSSTATLTGNDPGAGADNTGTVAQSVADAGTG